MDRLLELLSVSCELLDARFTLQVPQTDGAVMTCKGENVLKTDKVRAVAFTLLFYVKDW